MTLCVYGRAVLCHASLTQDINSDFVLLYPLNHVIVSNEISNTYSYSIEFTNSRYLCDLVSISSVVTP